MEKLRIGTQEFDLVPMGIDNLRQSNTHDFTIIQNSTTEELKDIILSGISQIDHIGNDGQVANSYYDCMALNSISANYDVEVNGELKDTFTIVLSTDSVLGEIRNLRQTNLVLEQKVAEQDETITYMQETLDTLVLSTLEPEGSEDNV